MKILIALSFILVFIIAVVFSVLNFHLVKVNLGFTDISLPLTVALTLELIAGITIGYFVVFFQNKKIKSEYSRLKKQMRKKNN